MSKVKGRMFGMVTKTWNPITGCLHRCVYCWARRLVETRLKNTKKYRKCGFSPTIHMEEFKVTFKPNELVFVSDMGDMWGEWVSSDWIMKVLEHVRKFPKTKFLFLTKYPRRYLNFSGLLKKLDNVILGATIETDRTIDYLAWKISEAPAPDARMAAMWALRLRGFKNLMVSIEPILDFRLETFVDMILKIEPEFIYVGYDNYNNKLPEPPLEKTLRLIKELRDQGFTVYEKTIRKAWYEVKE